MKIIIINITLLFFYILLINKIVNLIWNLFISYSENYSNVFSGYLNPAWQTPSLKKSLIYPSTNPNDSIVRIFSYFVPISDAFII
jgi:hypothetical protein